jgi:hypothetical protein
MLRRVAHLGKDVSGESSASNIRVTRIGELGKLLDVITNRRTLRRSTKALGSYETSVFIRAIRRNISEDGLLHSHRRENLKPYIALNGWTL